MSDFVQTVKDWRRMCDSMNKHGGGCCINCPLCGFSCGGVFEMPENTNWQLLQEKIAAWAAENPEPVYPTWREWLNDIGVVGVEYTTRIYTTANKGLVQYVSTMPSFYRPIPADIAEKLGLKPKGGIENG